MRNPVNQFDSRQINEADVRRGKHVSEYILLLISALIFLFKLITKCSNAKRKDMRKISKEVTLLDVITCTLAMLAPLSNHNLNSYKTESFRTTTSKLRSLYK